MDFQARRREELSGSAVSNLFSEIGRMSLRRGPSPGARLTHPSAHPDHERRNRARLHELERGQTQRFTSTALYVSFGAPENVTLKVNGKAVHVPRGGAFRLSRAGLVPAGPA